MNRLENSFKKYLMKIMGMRWDAQSHEDQYSNGIPDISYGVDGVNGWIELKAIPEWKKTITKPKKFTSEQINWLNRREKKGGNCFVMIKIDEEVFLFESKYSKLIARGMTKTEYYDRCIKMWHRSLVPRELVDILSRHSFGR